MTNFASHLLRFTPETTKENVSSLRSKYSVFRIRQQVNVDAISINASRREILASQVHLVEIDLLRGGEHSTAVPLESTVEAVWTI